MKKIIALILAAMMLLTFAACASKTTDTADSTADTTTNTTEPADTAEPAESTDAAEDTADSGKVFKIGLCNYVDDASLNQIVENIQTQLAAIGEQNGVTFEVEYDNCNADANVLAQIISNFKADGVDLMIGVATPVAISMQAETEGTDIPVVFSAVSDPISCGLVASLDAPGANITGTSDALDTSAVLNLIFAANPTPPTSVCSTTSARTPPRPRSPMRRPTLTRRASAIRNTPARPSTRSSLRLRPPWPTASTPSSPRPTTPS